tara:strand:- start:23 stop:805 length:783 start_codon:yes stop_codon:yes gene_type:complete
MKKTQALFRKLKNKRLKREIIEIRCGGGLGNRLSTLIGGLEIAKIRNLQPEVIWKPVHSCYAKATSLFDTSLKFNNFGQNINIIHSNPKIPEYVDLTSTIQNLLQIKPKKYIIEKVSDFINRYNIDSNVIGIHIRKTDFVEDIDINFWVDTVMSNPSKRYFVCSDEEKVESKFNCFPNVIVHPKKEYVIKRIYDQPWIVKDYEYKGKLLQYNVSRSKQSVMEALCDLLILSHTDIQDTSKYSTFLHLAKYYKTILDKVMN